MDQQRSSLCSTTRISSVLLLLLLLLCSCTVNAYENYTVGGSSGWFDSQEKPDVDYQKWADAKSFALGDFLIFNTDTNHSVIQTYNFTTYKLCNSNDALENDTTEWSTADPSSISPTPVSVPVPLVKEGFNYFFSGNYDGDQCKFGQRFEINVKHGQGLPPSLKPPSRDHDQTTAAAASAPGPNGRPDQSGDGDDESVPDTIVPANFDHPNEIQSDNDDTDGGKTNSAAYSTSLFANWVVFILMGLSL